MSYSPPKRRSQILSSPERGFLSSYLSSERNTELAHRDALAAARAEHDRVRDAAIRVYELHELQQEHQRIVEQERKEQERLKAEAAVAAEELRLRELKKKSIPKPPPEPEPEPESKSQVVPQKSPAASQPAPAANATEAKKEDAPRPVAPITNGIFSNQSKPASSNPFASPQKSAEVKLASTSQANGILAQPAQPVQPTKPTPPAVSQSPAPASATNAERYTQIHQQLKKLRKDLMDLAKKEPNSPLKKNLGNMRREIRTAVGQLSTTKGANAAQSTKILNNLNAALSGEIPSPAMDISLFVVDKNRQPEEGAKHNGPAMPALFIYLLNICSKGIINQFINECGPNPKAADPIGVFTAQIFSRPEFQWRGKPLIDILMAKFRIVCPALFGQRANDNTPRGRTIMGWRKSEEGWITPLAHNDRMTGLGAGFAAIALRDFSKTSKASPYPPSNYWIALAGIVNTPPSETSDTQYLVLRSMIQGHEQRILTFFGNAGAAALRLALIEFPRKAKQQSPAVGALSALVDLCKADLGLILE